VAGDDEDWDKLVDGRDERELRKLTPYDVVGKAATAMERFYWLAEWLLCDGLTYSTRLVGTNCLSQAGKTKSLFELIQRIKARGRVVLETEWACNYSVVVWWKENLLNKTLTWYGF
jgi:hypothetical protein